MIRKWAGSVLVLAVAAVGWATEGDKDKKTDAQIRKVDAKAGTITLAVMGNLGPMDKTFAVSDSTRVVIYGGKEKKELHGKAALKEQQFKPETLVKIVVEDDKLTEIQFGNPGPQNHSVTGELKKLDGAAGTVIITIPGGRGKKAEQKEFSISEKTTVVIMSHGERKVITGKAALKDASAEAGTRVIVVMDAEDNVIQVAIGRPGGALPAAGK